MTGEWQPIETAPKDGIRILAWDRTIDEATIVTWFPRASNWYDVEGFLVDTRVWMPLPEPPKDPT